MSGNGKNTSLLESSTPELDGGKDLLARLNWYSNTNSSSHSLPSWQDSSRQPSQKPEVFPFMNPKLLGTGNQGVVWQVDNEAGSFALKFGNAKHSSLDSEIHTLAMLNEAFNGHRASNHIPRYLGWVYTPNMDDGLGGPYKGFVTERFHGSVNDYVELMSTSTFSSEQKELTLWSMMHQLAIVLDAIYFGPGTKDWLRLGHNDLSSINIFYRLLPSSKYPHIAVGDWGKACYEPQQSSPSAVQEKYIIDVREPIKTIPNAVYDIICLRSCFMRWCSTLELLEEDSRRLETKSPLLQLSHVLIIGDCKLGWDALPNARELLQWMKQMWQAEAPEHYGSSVSVVELQQNILAE
ncbi:hypothetical protein BT63DRAFT_482963 [Microthyrium microscopicum]|uniref:Protein kinase domain-containing protein n=1 Tax=Microthyrium microscopicum TaxID=703497 RepID=A0A6A6TYC5_9PEZI|nr:hypothetical protein BT63DRAFT_482963 [Microthyrium microscopicum]